LQAVDTTLILLIVILEFIALVINTGVYGWGMTVAIDNAIISVIVSATVSFGIFGLKEKWIEPRRWRRSAEAAKLEKKLEVFSSPYLSRNCSAVLILLAGPKDFINSAMIYRTNILLSSSVIFLMYPSSNKGI
jgi:hypothetical protein